MSSQYYTIRQLRFDVDFFSKEMAYELQNRLSRLYHQQVQQTLGNFFSANIPENALIRKDSLVVDLGSISYERLENELPERLEKALEELFAPLLSSKDVLHWNSQDFENLPAEKGYQFILEFYLLNGTLPWQAAVQHGLTWKVTLHQLYANDRENLRNLLLRLGRQTEVRKRLAFQTSVQDIEKIVNTIIPVEAPVILSYKKNIERTQYQKQFVKADTEDFEHAVSFFILTYLLAEPGSLFSQKMFIKSILNQMAGHFNVSYFALLDILHDALPVSGYAATTEHTLFEIIKELQLEGHAPAELNTTAQTTDAVMNLDELLELLQYYLNEGSLPVWSAFFNSNQKELSLYFKEAIVKVPVALRKIIFALTPTDAVVKRITELLPISELTGLIRFLWPGQTGFMEEYLHLLILVHTKGLLKTVNGDTFGFILQKIIARYIFNTENRQSGNSDFIEFSLPFLSGYCNTAIPVILNFLLPEADTPGLTDHVQRFQSLLEFPFTGFKDERIIPAGAVQTEGSKSINTNNQPIKIANILHYFMQYGTVPWWGKAYSQHSPEKLLSMLFALSVSETLIVLEQAGKQPASRKRFLWQFTDELTYQIFSYLPDWNFVTVATELMIELIEGIAAFSQITQSAFKQIIMEAVWLSYVEMNYKTFNENCFYLNVFKNLSQYSKLEPGSIARLFSGVIRGAQKEVTEFQKMRSFYSWSKLKNAPIIAGTDDTKDHRDSILYQIELTLGLFNSVKQAGRIPVLQPWVTANPYETLDSFLLKQHGPDSAPDLKQKQQKAIYLLEYYLSWNRLPEDSPVLNHKEQDNLLTELLLLLYLENREALMRILKSDKHSVNARMKVHQLFLPDHKGGDHKQLSLLLDDFIEKDALQYVREITGSGSVTGNPELKPALDRLLEKARAGNTEEQLKQLLKSSSLTKYVALHYGDETMEWLIEKRSGSDLVFKQQTALVRKLILSIATSTHDYQKLKVLLNEAALFYLSGLVQAKNISSYISFTFRYLAGSFYIASSAGFFHILLDQIQTTTSLTPAYKEVIVPVKNELEHQLKLQERELFLKRKMEEERKVMDIAKRSAEQKMRDESLKQETEKKITSVLKKGDKLYVGNAGLVLLHPFLSTYFTRLNLMEKGKFINLEARARAVHLLQYLACKTTENPEHELVLNKILCNYPIQEPLPLEVLISEQEISLSAELLQVAIERAGKLSSSSADGFRVSFLQRDGALTETAEEWTLRVDQRGYDLILQTLPWAFGMIKFQWMDKPIIVEWI
ncbi:hypothetical protein HDE68_002789 [Pedobacter cryoconitis]|uniref:Uncharacterized protein n=1 Tax=Pedobacter cryoconitis TaxID=188932 RepID=A0A7W9DZE3_9SPHI|nr:contractile injection system tape measure protein [Pedobacter cryoconitis]MBB5636876.1 hypothetical protein [Pedobacter cryoconitis]